MTLRPRPAFPSAVARVNLWLNVSADPVTIAGQPHAILAFNNITARKQAEEALLASERRERQRAQELAILIDAVPTPVVIVHDPESRHMSGNRAADELLRITPRGSYRCRRLPQSGPAISRPSRMAAN